MSTTLRFQRMSQYVLVWDERYYGDRHDTPVSRLEEIANNNRRRLQNDVGVTVSEFETERTVSETAKEYGGGLDVHFGIETNDKKKFVTAVDLVLGLRGDVLDPDGPILFVWEGKTIIGLDVPDSTDILGEDYWSIVERYVYTEENEKMIKEMRTRKKR